MFLGAFPVVYWSRQEPKSHEATKRHAEVPCSRRYAGVFCSKGCETTAAASTSAGGNGLLV